MATTGQHTQMRHDSTECEEFTMSHISEFRMTKHATQRSTKIEKTTIFKIEKKENIGGNIEVCFLSCVNPLIFIFN